ncbi:hypothetical protein [Streptomyces sp. WAC06614]|uniref:hypothetical protein n=1 Tax=Streptomyces sp. WAC06614 TaxID=2487416 RepID=UPI000F76A718|nr:hypothetical protein [Streptomyces sp. WAC06614]RSS83651.1 hypothetical protein EF918_02845 [Streptomyces sp. WAC06614]
MSDFQESSRRHDSSAAAVAQTVQDKTSEGAALVGGKAAEVGGTVKEQAADVVGEATSQARNLAGGLRDQLQGQAQARTKSLAQNVRRLAQELREMSENGKPDSTMAGVARKMAEGGNRAADRIEQRGPDGLLADLQNFARRRPGAFLASAAVAGFLIGRAEKGVVKAASAGTGSGEGSGPQAAPADRTDGGMPAVQHSGIPPGYDDLTDTYGQSQPPHVVPMPSARPPDDGSSQRAEGM